MRQLIIAAFILAAVALALADYHYASHTGTNTPPYASWATV